MAHLGGDEFGVLLEHCSLQQSRRLANALRRAIEGFRFPWEGFEYYFGVISCLIGPRVHYGQVIETRRNNRVVRVDRRVRIGTVRRLKDALESDDSESLNTSFVERLNLSIRQGSAHLRRRSTSHVRCEGQLGGHVELLRCHYKLRPTAQSFESAGTRRRRRRCKPVR